MRRWLKLHARVPDRVWENFAILSGIAAAVVLSVGIYKVVDLTSQNQQRINDIQQSRIDACQSTYKAFLDVFRPFFPPGKVKTWPKLQRDNWHKLEDVTNGLAAKCVQQTKP